MARLDDRPETTDTWSDMNRFVEAGPDVVGGRTLEGLDARSLERWTVIL
jgi:hypothetical protein